MPQNKWPDAPDAMLWFGAAGQNAADAEKTAVPAAVTDAAQSESLMAALQTAEAGVRQITQGGTAAHTAHGTAAAGEIGSLPAAQGFGSLPSAVSTPSMEDISRYFERDARRY